MAMADKIIQSDFSGHALHVREIDPKDMPEFVYKQSYTRFFAVRNGNADGVIFMYLGQGDKQAPREIVAWYRKHGEFWSGCGYSFKEAIEGAQRDGWLHA